MARGRYTPTGDNSNDSKDNSVITVEQALLDARKKIEKEIVDLRNANIKKQAEIEMKLAERKIVAEQELELKKIKALADYESKLIALNRDITEKELQKKREEYQIKLNKMGGVEALKLQAELHKENARLQREQIEAERELRKSIILDTETSNKEKVKAFGGELLTNTKDSFSISNLLNQLNNNITQLGNQLMSAVSTFGTYQGTINARIQGSGKTFQDISKTLSRSIGATPFLKTDDLYKNLSELVETGIVYNVEQRAFLQTISNKIVTTFDAHNQSLLRLVRLQQADSTAARMGLESYLTRFLNSTFQTTEYLSESFDNVSASLLEASSLLSSDNAVQFEYIVQKWLGSLSSVGLSSDATSKIASAIGNLGSGNISALSSDEGMQNLIVMAASKSGLDYSRILSNGFSSAEETNVLLRSIVTYMQDIASSSNKVVKSKYAEVFGVSVSDLVASLNLTSEEIATISNNYMNTQGAIDELAYQLSEVSSRMSMSEKLGNLYDNAMFSMSKTIGESPALYLAYKVADAITTLTGGIPIPAISVLGNMVDLNATVDQLIKNGVVVASAFGMMVDVMSGLGNTFNFENVLSSLNIGANADTIKKGTGLISRTSGESTSFVSYVGNASADDIQSGIVNNATSEQEKKLEVKKEASADATLNDINNYLLNRFDVKIDTITSLLARLGGNDIIEVENEKIKELSTSVLQFGETQVRLQETSGYVSMSSGVENITTFLKGDLNSKLDSIISLMMMAGEISAVSSGVVGNSNLPTIFHRDTSIQVAKANDTTREYDLRLESIDTNVSNIYNLLNSVIVGGSLRVSMDNIGTGMF